jgi:hypothetical protein
MDIGASTVNYGCARNDAAYRDLKSTAMFRCVFLRAG